LNDLYWDEADAFYYDMFPDGQKCKVPTIASWWPVLAEMSGEDRAAKMKSHLGDSLSFGGFLPTPSLSRSDPDFLDDGGYWRGSIWLPTTYMALKATDLCGDYGLARRISSRLLECMYRPYKEFSPHTIWECYSPTSYEPAKNKKAEWVRPDFCGWSALGPIAVFIEDVIGVKAADAYANTLLCDFEKNPEGKAGVLGYRFGNVVCNIVASAKAIEVEANRPFTLIADGCSYEVKAGKHSYPRRISAGEPAQACSQD
jgi:glycogen debranching enzyme